MVGGGAGALAATGYSRAVPLSNTATLDDFARADGPLGGNWSATAALVNAATGITISGGRMVYPASGADSAFLAPDFGPDVDFQLVPRSGWTLGDGDAVVVLARGGALGSSGWGAVFLVLIGGATTDTWELREKPVGGSASVLASVSGVSKLGPGDSIELEVIRTHVGAY
jgi:hypothetical protein